jgi:hypothetical protein
VVSLRVRIIEQFGKRKDSKLKGPRRIRNTMLSDSRHMIPLRYRARGVLPNKCLVCGSSGARRGEYPSSFLGKYMHPPCGVERVQEATKNHLSFEQWLEKCHPEIELKEQKRLIEESDVNTPMAFWEKLSVKQLMQVEMAGKSSKVVALLEEYGRHKDPVWRQEMFEFLMALGLSREEAERKLDRPQAVDPSQHLIH